MRFALQTEQDTTRKHGGERPGGHAPYHAFRVRRLNRSGKEWAEGQVLVSTDSAFTAATSMLIRIGRREQPHQALGFFRKAESPSSHHAIIRTKADGNGRDFQKNHVHMDEVRDMRVPRMRRRMCDGRRECIASFPIRFFNNLTNHRGGIPHMTRHIAFLLCAFLAAAPLWAAFPTVPLELDPVRIENSVPYKAEAFLYVWSDANSVFLRVEPKSATFWIDPGNITVFQNLDTYAVNHLEDEWGAVAEPAVTGPVTIKLVFEEHGHFNPATPYSLLYEGAVLYTINIYPDLQSWVYPFNGIWKNADGTINIYIQKYKTLSCALVITMGDGQYTAFLDSDYSDGVACSDDLDNRGYTVELLLQEGDSGFLKGILPGLGHIDEPISLRYPDTP